MDEKHRQIIQDKKIKKNEKKILNEQKGNIVYCVNQRESLLSRYIINPLVRGLGKKVSYIEP